ncbi:MAG: sulfatase [Anaerolineaceae bacterium]|nr:sulfatase [Anaerolineaceae bacterium]
MRILYIDIDSMRPDHLSCYGYHRQTSPNIDALAAEGVRFTNFYASDSPCLPSRTAFFLSSFGLVTGVINHGGSYADLPLQGPSRGFRTTIAENTLGTTLGRLGYKTISISPFPKRHTAYQIWYGFTETYDTGRHGGENADEMFPPLEKWLKANGTDDNWFLHFNMWDPHTPYDTPDDYLNPFTDDPIDDWLTQDVIDQQNASFGPHSATEVPGYTDEMWSGWKWGVGSIKNLGDAKAHMDGYDTGIHYSDYYVGKIVALLKELGIYEETAIIISADHGENQGELNIWGDHQTADQCTNRLPLVVRWPGITDAVAGQERSAFHYHLDLPATLVDILGGTAPDMWSGQSFASSLQGLDKGRDYLVISQGAWSCQRSVRWDDWLLIRTYHTGMKHFPEYMLFDVVNDPHETTNLASQKPEVVAQGLLRLDQWMGEQMPRALRGDPFWGVIQEGGPLHANIYSDDWKHYLVRLRETGRGHHADMLEKFGGKPFTSGLDD